MPLNNNGLKFEPGVLYPLKEIEKRLEGVVSIKTFLDHLGMSATGKTRMFEKAIWGDEVIKALHVAMEKTEKNQFRPVMGQRKRGSTKAALDRIDVSEVLDIGSKRA